MVENSTQTGLSNKGYLLTHVTEKWRLNISFRYGLIRAVVHFSSDHTVLLKLFEKRNLKKVSKPI